MNKLVLLIVLGLMFSCTHMNQISSEVSRKTASDGRVEVYEGVVKQVECNKPTGIGALELQVKNDRTLESTWFKVNSRELCSKEVPSKYFLGNGTPLTNLGAENISSENFTVSSIKVVDGFVVEVTEVKKIKYSEFLKRIDGYQTFGNREVLDWYFQNRKSQ